MSCLALLGIGLVASCSGTAGELFPPSIDAAMDPPSLGGGFGGRAGMTGSFGGSGGTTIGASTGSGGGAPLVSGGSGGAGGGASPVGAGSGDGVGGQGSEPGIDGDADAGAGSLEPAPPACDPCPCSEGPFGAPELVLGLGVGAGVPSFGPAPSFDSRTLYFSTIDGDEDIVFATRDSRRNEFSIGSLVAGVSGAGEEGTPFISADARSLYFFSTRPDPAARGGRDLWVAQRPGTSGPFASPRVVPVVNGDGLEHLPRLSADGLTLMFVSGRESPNLGSNIWQARRGSVQQPFGEPSELAGVNSNAREEGFWLSTDGLTVLFASNRAGAQPDMDIWVATRPDVDSAFGEADALDVVNTLDIEIDPALTSDGFELFFASDRNGTMQLYRSIRECP